MLVTDKTGINVLKAIICFVVVLVIIGAFVPKSKTVASTTLEVVDLDKLVEEREAKALRDYELYSYTAVKEAILFGAKNPDSVKIDHYEFHGRTLCVNYSGTNSFGARVRDVASFHEGVYSTSRKVFNAVC
jgi:hypothetical protein